MDGSEFHQADLFDRPTVALDRQLEDLRLYQREQTRLKDCTPAVQTLGPLILALARLAAQRDAKAGAETEAS